MPKAAPDYRVFTVVVITCVVLTFLDAGFTVLGQEFISGLIKIVVPAAVSLGVILLARSGLLSVTALRIFAYGLFFSVAVLTATGQMGVMNGLAASSPNPFLYGYSFYSASLAFAVLTLGRRIELGRVFQVANPLFLATGPIVVGVASQRHWSIQRRMDYFFPFLVVGAFLFVVIGVGLGPTLVFRAEQNIVSGLLFGFFFELFIYANFAGLSLVVYGLSGILGMRVPLNFMQPFSASNIVEFWKGWHRSLSVVLKEFFYLPVRAIGGTFAAVAVTYLASAAWHGMSLNFALWGLVHGVFYIVSIALLRAKKPGLALLLFPPILVVARLIFGTADFGDLVATLTTIPNLDALHLVRMTIVNWPIETYVAVALALTLVMSEFLFRDRPLFRGRNYKFLRTRAGQVLLIVAVILLSSGRVGEVIAAYGQR